MTYTRSRSLDPDEAETRSTKIDDHSVSIRVSRACRICTSIEPRFQSVLNPCGHAVCRACSLQLKSDAADIQQPVKCSMCRCEGTFSLMIEELMEGNQEGKCESDEATDSVDPLQACVREVADEERISASDEDRMIAEVRAARPICLAVIQEYLVAIRAEAQAERKVHNLTAVLLEATKALCAAQKKSYARNQAWVALLESCVASARVPTDTEMTENDEAMRSEGDTEALLNAACEEAIANRNSAEAVAAQLNTTKNEIKKKEKECVAKVEQVEKLIERFKKLNEDCATRGLRFSRACRACNDEQPLLRSFFPACGHAVCRGCADKAVVSDADVSCPTCHKAGGCIPLFEEMLEN